MAARNHRTTFAFDEKTLDVLDQLRTHYHAASRAEVLRRAIALLSVAQNAEEIILRERDEKGELKEKHVVVG